MKFKIITVMLIFLSCFSQTAHSCGTDKIPDNFVDIQKIIPGVLLDIRYYGPHNFVGERVDGYLAPKCFLTTDARYTKAIPAASVQLTVTSPPFLDVVQYATDNWLRCWFLGLDAQAIAISVPKKLEKWQEVMSGVFRELARVLRPGGHVAFEVGEVHGGKTKLEEAVLPCGVAAGLTPRCVVINDQEFTKTANCWGVDNMSKGTNTNRIVVMQKTVV